MEANTTIDESLKVASSLLGIPAQEMTALLESEFQSIQTDPYEKGRYPSNEKEYCDTAIREIGAMNGENLAVLQKLIYRDELRRLYFDGAEIEAVRRILVVIEDGNINHLDLSNLGLLSLPLILEKTHNLESLDISRNRLQAIYPVPKLAELQFLNASDNQIQDISFLRHNKKLKTLWVNHNNIKGAYDFLEELPLLEDIELAGNRINDTLMWPILRHGNIKRVRLEDNPINAPLNILNDIDKLSERFRVTRPMNAENKIPVANEPPPSPTNKTAQQQQYLSYAIRDIRLRGNPDKILLDIEKLAPIFYDLISNSDKNGEHFFGLFGRWGRGKTFFWKYLLQNNLSKEKYIPIEFHAWKYQDTPGIWAYLYNTLNEAFLGDKPKWWQFKKLFHYFAKLVRLNSQRGKLLTVAIMITGIVGTIIGYFYNQKVYGDDLVSKILRLGIPAGIITLIVYMAKTFTTDARKIITALTTNVNFNSQLGFQHEIQHELKCLLKAWIPEKEKFNKRIFLFIDDIDRCSEDKIIQIVDYIRVLLHCEAIQDRVTVLAAIDERILLHAIQEKYKRFIENKDNDATYKELCREYMDKLFLAGLKLGPLTEFEKRQIVEGFTDADTSNEEVWVQYDQQGINSNVVGEVLKQTQETDEAVQAAEAIINKVEIPQDINQEASIPVTPNAIPSTARKEYPYEKWEQEFIKDILAINTESTPRSIRVYTYRYLLGKQLVEKALRENKTSWKQWYQTQDAKKCFALQLLHYGFKSDTDHLLADYKSFITGYNESNVVKSTIYRHELELNQELGSIMYQVLTMIIAY